MNEVKNKPKRIISIKLQLAETLELRMNRTNK